MAVGLDQDTESLQRGSIPSGGAGTLSDGAFANMGALVWVYRPTSGNSYGLTADGHIIHLQAGAREVKVGFDNTFGSGTASDPLLQALFNSGGVSGAVQTFAGANFLDEWVAYFYYEASATQHIGYIRLSAPNTVVKISRANDNAGSQYANTLTFGNNAGSSTATLGRYAYGRAKYASGLTDSDMIAWAASTAPLSGDWGFWPLDTNTDNVDDSGNGRDLTFNGTLTTETSPTFLTITSQPADATVNAGVAPVFSITATGATSYQWQDNSSGSFANVSGGSGATTATYTAPAAAYSHQGRLFRCVLNGSTNSNSATLRVEFNLTGTGPRAYPVIGGVIGAGSVESWLRGTDAGGGSGPVGTSTESDTALAMGRASPAGVCTTVDAGLALTGLQVRAAGLAAESDQALALLPAANGAVGTAVESDVALARGVARPAGFAAESDAALALAGVAIRGVGAALESDVALALPARQVRAVGLAIESDAALALNSTGGAAVGLASETDVAIARGVARPVGAGVESNLALALVPRQVRAVGMAVEVDAAISLGGSAGTAVELAEEIDTALPRGSARPAAAAVETNTALALSASLIRQAGLAAEADVALALAAVQRLGVGMASEADSALQLFAPGAMSVGVASEINLAFALSREPLEDWAPEGRGRIGAAYGKPGGRIGAAYGKPGGRIGGDVV